MVGAVLAMILAIGLGVDGSRALQGFLRASGEAQEAARAGADVLMSPRCTEVPHRS